VILTVSGISYTNETRPLELRGSTNMQPETIVYEELPLLSTTLSTSHSEWSDDEKNQFYEREHNCETKHIKKALLKIPEEKLQFFRQLPNGSGCWRTDRLDISHFKRHARIRPQAPEGNETLTSLAVPYNASYINHSFSTNAVFCWNGEHGIVRATDVIQIGEKSWLIAYQTI
jgi:hypothetical protein